MYRTQFTEIIFNIKFNIFNKNLKFISIKYSVLFYITNAASECVSDCCLTPNEQFVSYINKMIMMFALYLINMLRSICSASSLSLFLIQQSMGRQSDPL